MKVLICLLFCLLLWPKDSCNAQYYKDDTTEVYDFNPRYNIIFEDDFRSDTAGAFPHKWTTLNCVFRRSSNGCAKVIKDGDGAMLELTEGMCKDNTIEPDSSKPYIKDSFTLEYDFRLSDPDDRVEIGFPRTPSLGVCPVQTINISGDGRKYFLVIMGIKDKEGFPEPVCYSHSVPVNTFDLAAWHHFAVSFCKQRIKCYLDNRRYTTMFNCDYAPHCFCISCKGVADFRNVRLACGAETKNEMDNLLTSKKFVTHAINFDLNSANIKQESYGFINQLAYWLKQNPAIKLEIDGHTDNDGSAALNAKLSQARADEIKKQLEARGINGKRLATKGYGDKKPIQPNTSPEGKAANRRVEFIKL
jgi:OOP family OmpA-OmpF porin